MILEADKQEIIRLIRRYSTPGPQGVAGPAGPTGPSGGGSLILYLDDTASGVLTYQSLLEIANTTHAEETDSTSVTAADGEKLIGAYITVAGFPGITVIPTGLWQFDFYCDVSSTSGGNSQLVLRLFKRTSGGVETELLNLTTTNLSTTQFTLISSQSAQGDFVVNVTDRLVLKVFAKTASAAAKTVRFYHNGNSHYSHFHTPISQTHGLPPGGTTGQVLKKNSNSDYDVSWIT